jgi:AcrR family transcriptional regulator
MFDPEAAVPRGCGVLASATSPRGDLTARRLTALLDQSTTVLYHYFGSLESLLIRVDGAVRKSFFAELEVTRPLRELHGVDQTPM